MEYFWLVMGVATVIMALYQTSNHGLQEAYPYLLMPILPLAMFYMRRAFRKKMEKREE